ncbi:MAG: hypothetical protein M1818_002238 [Claussenomyces sp. TS43310]|nr:MAG: hypothetical protein M1818_002238 [Claussenomyces sp. TS43310]
MDRDDPLPPPIDGFQQNNRNAPSEATPLGAFDVFSLITNKMIGTGIYTAPYSVLIYTRNKQLALGLWGVGFFYTIMSMFIYLDYAAVFPYTGGEIVYVDEITSSNTSSKLSSSHGAAGEDQSSRGHIDSRQINGQASRKRSNGLRGFSSRLMGDGLLAYTIYAFLFVGLFTSATNYLQVGREILISIEPDKTPNNDLIRFIGVVVLSIIAFIQLFSARAGRVLNGGFALVKIAFLLILLCFGFQKLARDPSPGDFTTTYRGLFTNNATTIATNNTDSVPPVESNYAAALIGVLWSYEGWENANFVAGEISTKDPATLRKGFVWAVFVVGTLYMALNAVFLSAVSFVDLGNAGSNYKQFNYAALLSSSSAHDLTPSSQRAWAIIIAISAAGNANTVIYTFTRVKQSIGQANVLPWSSLWKKDFNPAVAFGTRHKNGDRYKTPLGGILLEWISSVIFICITSAVSGTSEFVSLAGNVQTYAHCFVLVVLGLGLFRLKSREKDLGVIMKRSWFPRISHVHWTILGTFVIVYTGMNIFILVESAKQDTEFVEDPSRTFQGRWYPTVLLATLVLSTVYYYGVFADHVPHLFTSGSILRAARVECDIRKEPNFDMRLLEVRRFGHRRTIAMRLSNTHTKTESFLYWFFGGQVHHTPIEALEEGWMSLTQKADKCWDTLGKRLVSRRGSIQSRGEPIEETEMENRA